MHESDFPNRDAYVRARVAYLRQKLSDLGGLVSSFEETDPESELAFLEHIYALEKAPSVTHAHQLISRGIRLPPPDDLDDTHLHLKLREVIQGLAELRVFLEFTDHLSDREVYELLWYDLLNEITFDMSGCKDGATHLPLLNDSDMDTYLACYASDEERAHWASQDPDTPLPPRRPLACDRDQHLPKP